MKPDKPPSASLQDLQREYHSLTPQLEKSCSELTLKITELLARHRIHVEIPIQHRIKLWDSIVEKITRKQLTVRSLRDIGDLIGFRLILLFHRDVQRVCRVLEAGPFMVHHSENTTSRLESDRFGYSSIHYVVTIGPRWSTIPLIKPLKGFSIEIQVRSVAQHVWAAASHTLQYKSQEAIPTSVARAINRVSALLETVDLEFERVLQQRDSYAQELEGQSEKKTGNLNVDLLQHILDKHLPKLNKDLEKGESYGDLLRDLFSIGIKTSTDLGELLRKYRRNALKEDSMIVRRYRNRSGSAHSSRIKRGVFFSHTGLIYLMLKARCPETRFVSPNGKLQAIVGFSNKFLERPYSISRAYYESKLRILDDDQKQLARFDFSSEDGDHGRFVNCASWSPDSQFFLFTTSSSGGHSPWQYVTYFYNSKTNTLAQLWEKTGPIMHPEFEFVGKHTVRVAVQDLERWETEWASKQVDVDLSTCKDDPVTSNRKLIPTKWRRATDPVS